MLLRRRERLALTIGGVLLLAIVGTAAWWFERPAASPTAELARTAEYAVANHLHVRGTLHFNTAEEAQITQKSNTVYEVRGWVSDVGPDGITQSYFYFVTLERDPGHNQDRVVQISVVEQY